ncbi:hypothetical protein GGR92_004800 [Spirosoma lacussanchae]|uniref:hypothetical protein n=1 Tax=Spirosoma lacussanchae TaxID=1884249 RepID=UPI0011093AF7|nr:hypothetical protein [Spirosoma lacussanchae]
MEIKHNLTRKTQTISKADWQRLVDQGYDKNFTVVTPDDYVPEEIKDQPPAQPAPRGPKGSKE